MSTICSAVHSFIRCRGIGWITSTMPSSRLRTWHVHNLLHGVLCFLRRPSFTKFNGELARRLYELAFCRNPRKPSFTKFHGELVTRIVDFACCCGPVLHAPRRPRIRVFQLAQLFAQNSEPILNLPNSTLEFHEQRLHLRNHTILHGHAHNVILVKALTLLLKLTQSDREMMR